MNESRWERLSRLTLYAHLAIAGAVLVFACGCGGFHPFRAGGGIGDIPKPPGITPPDPTSGWAFLSWLGFACVAGGIGVLIASCVPVVSTFVPRKAAATAILCGIGCVLARQFLDRFGIVILWGSFALLVVGALCLAWPVLVAAHRGTLLLKARELLANGHVAEAAAFKITATPGASKSPSIRKAILATMKGVTP